MSSPDPDPAPTPPESTRRYRRTLSRLLVALLASWLLMLLPLPWSLLAGIAGVVTGVLLVLLVIASFRDHRPTMGIVTAVVGLPAVLMIVLGSVTGLVFYGPMSELESCRSKALTHQAEESCQDDVQNSVVSWMEGLTGS